MTNLISGNGERIVPVDSRRPTAAGYPGLLQGSGDRAETAPPPRRSKFEPARSPYLPDQLREMPSWHALVLRVSEPVRQARTALEAEIDALQAARDALEELPVQQKVEQAEHERQIREALAAGRPMPKVKATDWQSRRAVLDSEERVRAERARELHREYAATVQRELPAARDALAAGLEDKRAAALEALRAFEPAVREFMTTVAALDVVALKLDPDSVAGQTTAEAQRVRAAGRGAVDAVAALLLSDDPVVSGRRHTEPSPHEVPLWTRAAWAQGSESDIARLATLEASEGWAGPSSYTERDFPHLRRAE